MKAINASIIPESNFLEFIKSDEFIKLTPLEKAKYVRANSLSKEYILFCKEKKTGKIIWTDLTYYSYLENSWVIKNKGYIRVDKSKKYEYYYLI